MTSNILYKSILLEDWNEDLVDFLESIRRKSVKLSQKHTNSFFYYKSCLNYFDIPIIILSVLSASFGVGTKDFLQQSVISLVGCGVNMIIAILSSIKLYLNLSSNLNSELEISKALHILSLDIGKTLTLPYELRQIEQLEYLNKTYDTYTLLIEKSSLVKSDEETERMSAVIAKIKSSPKFAMKRQPTLSPLQIPINNEVTFGD